MCNCLSVTLYENSCDESEALQGTVARPARAYGAGEAPSLTRRAGVSELSPRRRSGGVALTCETKQCAHASMLSVGTYCMRQKKHGTRVKRETFMTHIWPYGRRELVHEFPSRDLNILVHSDDLRVCDDRQAIGIHVPRIVTQDQR